MRVEPAVWMTRRASPPPAFASPVLYVRLYVPMDGLLLPVVSLARVHGGPIHAGAWVSAQS
jgi:hypothetical protein